MTAFFSTQEFYAWLQGKPVRYAKVSSRATSPETIAKYLPANYQIITRRPKDYVVIAGSDHAGWTLDGYVIPRLASGLVFAEELEAVTAEVYHNISRDAFFGLNTVFREGLGPKNAKQQAESDEERHPLVKVFQYPTYLDKDLDPELAALNVCERAFRTFQNDVGTGPVHDAYRDRKLRSLSVGDVVTVNSEPHSVESVGFAKRDRSELRIVTDYDPVPTFGERVITVPWGA